MTRIAKTLLLMAIAITVTVSPDVRVSASRAYCDLYYVCNGWDGEHCFDVGVETYCDSYDDPGDDGDGGGGGTFEPVKVEIPRAAIRDNTIVVR